MASQSSLLASKVALVTGGSGTIGQAIAKSLLSQGASVILTARRLEKLEEVQEVLRRELPGKESQVHVITSDVSKEETVVELFEKIDKLDGGKGLDLLVNNAGIMALQTRCESKQGYEKHLAVNHFGHFLLTKLLMKKLMVPEQSRIVNVSSLAHKNQKLDLTDLHL